MLKVERFINELMNSNCYLIWDGMSHKCIVIDPGSEKSIQEIEFIESNGLILDYIILTHEHTDHTWGVNALIDRFPDTKVICHKECADRLEFASSSYFKLYFDDESYSYKVKRVDVAITESNHLLGWNQTVIAFEYTPGHSKGSVCVIIGNMIFTGDTIMPFKPHISKRDGSRELYNKSVEYLKSKYIYRNMTVYPGHGTFI